MQNPTSPRSVMLALQRVAQSHTLEECSAALLVQSRRGALRNPSKSGCVRWEAAVKSWQFLRLCPRGSCKTTWDDTGCLPFIRESIKMIVGAWRALAGLIF